MLTICWVENHYLHWIVPDTDLILNVDVSNTADSANISPRLILEYSWELLPYLLHFFSLTINNSGFLEKLRVLKSTPISTNIDYSRIVQTKMQTKQEGENADFWIISVKWNKLFISDLYLQEQHWLEIPSNYAKQSTSNIIFNNVAI